jgi:SRSO17 transposase
MAETAWLYLQGLLSNLPRKTAEPIAELHDVDRKVPQRFVGVSPWSDRKVRDGILEDVAQTIGDPDGVLSVDPSGFPKKGTESVGVTRQWCGRSGKKDNCQVGVFAAYASPKGRSLLDVQLALPEKWVDDKEMREKCHIPEDRKYLTHWELADEVILQVDSIPHACILADSEMGRCGEFRDRFAQRNENYIFDIPVSLKIQIVEKGKPISEPIQVGEWLATRPKWAWLRVNTREGSQGERIFEVCQAEVLTTRKDGTARRETLLALRPVETPHDVRLALARMPKGTSIEKMTQYATRRWTIEDCLERGKSECGMGHYEVRSWVGWHHHMTMAMLAAWLLEKLRLAKSKSFPPSDVPTVRIDSGGDHLQSRRGFKGSRKANIKTNKSNQGGSLLPQTKSKTLLQSSGSQ